jgi:methionyl aminopeptidase
MTFTIEPIINAGVANTVIDRNDHWTVYTMDKKNSAQWEHTILVTEDNIEILTLRKEEKHE